ncbi:MAG: M14 family metallopeptidase [Gammaproteobacteria bacterium]
MRRSALLPTIALIVMLIPCAAVAQDLPQPRDVFGFNAGDDYQLADYQQALEYYRQLDAATDRMQMIQIGESALGKPMYLIILSSEENMRDLERWRSVSERLGRARLEEQEAQGLAREGRAVVWIDGGLDDQEYATAQMMPELVYRVAAEESAEIRKIRSNVVALLMPHMNPDADENDVTWYRRYRGTPWEITQPPRLGQVYVGSDNNRDWFMITQPETWAASRVFYHEWYPQIVYNQHQTGPSHTRIFIPPYADPVNPDIHPGVVAGGVNMVGAAMASRYATLHMPGYVSRAIFSMWWNGGMRLAPYYHNMIGILTETSHESPTPYYSDTDNWPETVPVRRGEAPRTDGTSIFYPYPWFGAESHFRMAVDYMIEASIATLNLAANYREELLYNFYRMGRDGIEWGNEGDPFAYVVPVDQWDPSAAHELLSVLRRGGRRRPSAPAGASSQPVRT